MKVTMHAITMSITAAWALQSGYAHGIASPVQATAGFRTLAGKKIIREVTLARETQPGDDRGGKESTAQRVHTLSLDGLACFAIASGKVASRTPFRSRSWISRANRYSTFWPCGADKATRERSGFWLFCRSRTSRALVKQACA
jgi:hypothetical protein